MKKILTETIEEKVAKMKEWSGYTEDGTATSGFKYEHNPSDNPNVLQDAIEDSNAIYGYRPSENGSVKAFANDDWSDAKLVNSYKKNRIKYHQENDVNAEITNQMRNEGKTDSEIAHALVERRNNNRLASYIDENGRITDINKYNQALEHCKTYEELKLGNGIKPGKTDLEIITSSTKGNPGFDACTGLYDVYFDTYNFKER